MSMTKEELEGLLAAPAMEAPEDITPDFDSPPNRNGLALFVTTFCLAVSVLCVILRTYARVWRVRAIHKEESMYPRVPFKCVFRGLNINLEMSFSLHVPRSGSPGWHSLCRVRDDQDARLLCSSMELGQRRPR